MIKKSIMIIFMLFVVGAVFAGNKEIYDFNFEKYKLGSIPDNWKSEITGHGKNSIKWAITSDSTAPSGTHVLTMKSPKFLPWSIFNLCWTNKIAFKDGELDVYFKAIKGRMDQGGGIMWRVSDRNNYYVARFNPLEDNFRIYYVKNGGRHLIKSSTVRLEKNKWHKMKIIQKGSHYKCYLDGEKLMEGDVNIFNKSGGVGLWTKSDAVTSFDNFSVKIFK